MHTVVAELVSGSIRTIREKPAWWMVRSTSVRPCSAPCSGSPTWCRLRLQLASNTPRGARGAEILRREVLGELADPRERRGFASLGAGTERRWPPPLTAE